MIPPEQKLEIVVYMARKFGWSLRDIGKLTPSQFVSLYNELMFQESVNKWEERQNLAILLAAIYNTIPKSRGSKTFSAKDFYDIPRPTRGKEDERVMTEVDSRAGEAGIILPKN